MTPHGGARPGAGRKRLREYDKGRRVMHYFPAWVAAWLEVFVPAGKRSGFVTNAVKAAIEREGEGK